jgi:hypothetical protein
LVILISKFKKIIILLTRVLNVFDGDMLSVDK